MKLLKSKHRTSRYLFTTKADHANLYNGANLLASPFRTDDW